MGAGVVSAHEHVSAQPQPGSGRQSKFRKQLTNLNKAAAKWLHQEQCGDLPAGATEERVRKSAVFAHLRESRGDQFQEDCFVTDLLSRVQTRIEAKQQFL